MKTHNRNLPFIKENWSGNPITKSSRYRNIEFPFLPKMKDVIKWQTDPKPFNAEKKANPVDIIVNTKGEFLNTKKDGICWLGHATFLIRIGGQVLLTDPVFESPSFLMKRFSALPFLPSDIGKIDYLLLSHDHRDHIDIGSLKTISIQNPNIKTLTGLGIENTIRSALPKAQIQEAGWYQEYRSDDLSVYYLPSRHWGRRFLTDTNTRLWGAFIIRSKDKTIYFGGDSGYGSHFEEVKTLFGQIDVAILGIGAYMPEWFMGPSHTSPKDALQAAQDLGCKKLIPMHHSTFDLADEPMYMPQKELMQLYQNNKFNFEILNPLVGDMQYL